MIDLTEEHLAGLERALERTGGSHALQHVLAAIQRNEAQLWIEGPCVIVTEVNDTPLRRELHFWLAAGTLDEVICLSNKVIDWGREQGCTVATLCGRRGWTKALANEGWDHQLSVMGRRLDG
jgi:hypothetical protein